MTIPALTIDPIDNSKFPLSLLEQTLNVDWLTIYQDHHDKAGKLRKINNGMLLNLEDLDSYSDEFHKGETEINTHWHDGQEYKELWRSYKKYLVEGSHSTRLMLFCDGTRVFLSGNIGRFGRRDNLFNLSFGETIQKANKILAKFGLPAFTFGKTNCYPSLRDGRLIRSRLYGAVITRCDVNVNFATGSPENAQYLVDYLQTRSISHVSKSVSGRSSAQWGRKGGRLFTKAYVKHEELMAHCKTKDRESLEKSFAYQYAKKHGVVRIETEIDRKTLADSGLRDLEQVTMAKLARYAKEKIDQLLNFPQENLEYFDPLQVFTEKKHIKTISMWKAGLDLQDRRIMSKTTFYRHRNEILEISGIDISERFIEGVSIEARSLINRFDVKPLSCPENYKLHVNIDSLPEMNVINLLEHLPTRKDINEATFKCVPTQEFRQIDLSKPNYQAIAERKAEEKRRYEMRKLYEIHKENKRNL
ncbi:phage/plasmid replication domain-containing protein [Wohlfahrtiimonas chitiniclastica]|uniref:phage/plasmid replication domain-containing protein n=1 Tax=Wohlfahrtiimonas chitiniclastica TaxID=400946 RepID=UPI00037EAE54|nr:phage/plasmid replication protein [Wohlfahrtiimonas chitiniclastica]OYQ71465.1 hypothetical protein B9T13_01995 [Wohlfahrtiimonas chitiniclastica]